MDTLAFLAPWINALAPHIFVPLFKPCRSHNEDDGVHAFSMMPHTRVIALCFAKELVDLATPDRVKALKTLRQAMIIVDRALWIEPKVWSLLELRKLREINSSCPPRIDYRLFRHDGFQPLFLLANVPCCDSRDWCHCSRLTKWLPVFRELFEHHHEDDDENASDDAFRAAMEMLTRAELDSQARNTASRVVVKPPVVTLVLNMTWDLDAAIPPVIAATLEAIARTRWVSTPASTDVAGATRPFHVARIHLCRWGFDELSQSEALARVCALGIRIGIVEVGTKPVRGSSDATCLRTLAASPATGFRKLGLCVGGDGQHLGRSYALLHAASTLVPLPMDLNVRVSSTGHLLLLVRLLLATWSRDTCGVRSVELTLPAIEPFSASDWLCARLTRTSTRHQARIDTSSPEGAALLRCVTEMEPDSPIDERTVFATVKVDDCLFLKHPSGQLVHVPVATALNYDATVKGRLLLQDPQLTRPLTLRAKPHDDDDNSSSIGVFRCTVKRCSPGIVTQLLLLMHAGFPKVRSLELRILGGELFTSETVATILYTYPLLEALKLRGTSLTSLDAVLDAVRDGQCSRLRVLSLDAGHMGFVPFLMALADPQFPLSKTLKEIKLHYVHDQAREYLRGLETMLTHNPVLQFLELVLLRMHQNIVAPLHWKSGMACHWQEQTHTKRWQCGANWRS